MAQDLRTLIVGSTAVTALLSTRVHYNKTPESAEHPNVRFRTNADDEELTMDGAGGLHQARVDLECNGRTEDSAQSVADAVKTRLHGFKGAMGNVTAQGIFLSAKDDSYIPFSNEGDEGIHTVAFDTQVWYTT